MVMLKGNPDGMNCMFLKFKMSTMIDCYALMEIWLKLHVEPMETLDPKNPVVMITPMQQNC